MLSIPWHWLHLATLLALQCWHGRCQDATGWSPVKNMPQRDTAPYFALIRTDYKFRLQNDYVTYSIDILIDPCRDLVRTGGIGSACCKDQSVAGCQHHPDVEAGQDLQVAYMQNAHNCQLSWHRFRVWSQLWNLFGGASPWYQGGLIRCADWCNLLPQWLPNSLPGNTSIMSRSIWGMVGCADALRSLRAAHAWLLCLLAHLWNASWWGGSTTTTPLALGHAMMEKTSHVVSPGFSATIQLSGRHQKKGPKLPLDFWWGKYWIRTEGCKYR